jgi:hypothetical protein
MDAVVVRKLVTEMDYKINQASYNVAEAGFSNLRNMAGNLGIGVAAGMSSGIGISMQRADRLIKNFAGSQGVKDIENLAIVPTIDKASLKKAAGEFLRDFDELDTFKQIAPLSSKLATNVGQSLQNVTGQFSSYLESGNTQALKSLGLVSSKQLEIWRLQGINFSEMHQNMRKYHLMHTFLFPNSAKINEQYADSLGDIDVQAMITKKGLTDLANKIFLQTAPTMKSALQLTNSFFESVANDPFGQMLIKASAASVGIMGIGVAFTVASKLASMAKLGGPLFSKKGLLMLGKGGLLAGLILGIQDLYNTLKDPEADTQLRQIINDLESLNKKKFEKEFPAISGMFNRMIEGMKGDWDGLKAHLNDWTGFEFEGGYIGFLNSMLHKLESVTKASNEMHMTIAEKQISLGKMFGMDSFFNEGNIKSMEDFLNNMPADQQKELGPRVKALQDQIQGQIEINAVQPGKSDDSPGAFSQAWDMFNNAAISVGKTNSPAYVKQLVIEHIFKPIQGRIDVEGMGKTYSLEIDKNIEKEIQQIVKDSVEMDYRRALLGTGD